MPIGSDAPRMCMSTEPERSRWTLTGEVGKLPQRRSLGISRGCPESRLADTLGERVRASGWIRRAVLECS